jgi:hypothetical protein
MLNEDKHEAGKLSQVDAFGSTVVPINSADIEEHSPSIRFKDGERPSGPKYDSAFLLRKDGTNLIQEHDSAPRCPILLDPRL